MISRIFKYIYDTDSPVPKPRTMSKASSLDMLIKRKLLDDPNLGNFFVQTDSASIPWQGAKYF